MCIVISIAFASCSNNTPSENEMSSQVDNQVVSEQKTDSDTVTETSTKSNIDSEKTIEKLYVNYNGFKMDVDFDEDDIADLLDAEKNATVPDVKMKMVFADVIAVYNDNTEEIFGTVCVGEDDSYYLQFANSEVEGAAFKMPDSSFTDGLL